jgi:predicted ester cyclase
MVLLSLVLLLTSETAWASSDAATPVPLTASRARQIVAPFYEALSAGHDVAALIGQATSPEWTSCGANEGCRSRDQVTASVERLHDVVPNLRWTIDDVLVSGDRVTVRGEASGTPAGTFMGAPAAGGSFRIMSIDVHTVRDGKIIRSYHVEDWMGAVRQLTAH